MKVNAVGNPFNNNLPVLKYNNYTFTKVKDIIEIFRENNYNTEQDLSRKECAKIMAYDVLLKEKLFPALQFIWYVHFSRSNGFEMDLIQRVECKFFTLEH